MNKTFKFYIPLVCVPTATKLNQKLVTELGIPQQDISIENRSGVDFFIISLHYGMVYKAGDHSQLRKILNRILDNLLIKRKY